MQLLASLSSDALKYNSICYFIQIYHCLIDSTVYLCDFHREQAWERWLNAGHNGLTSEKADLLSKMRKIAAAQTEEMYFATKTELEV